MTIVGFHASHEQLPPSRLLDAVQRAEQAGFDARDVLATTSRRGACGRASPATRGAGSAPRSQATSLLARRRHRARAAVPPGDRRAGDRHPRGDVSPAGSGRRSAAARRSTSTSPATRGPPKDERDARLVETVDVIRRLLARRGGHRRRAHPRRPRRASGACPPVPPPLFGAAVSTETAARMRRVGRRAHHRRPAARRAARRHRRLPRRRRPRARSPCRCTSAGRRPTTRPSRSRTTSGATSLVPAHLAWELDTPEAFDERTADATPDEVAETVHGLGRPGPPPRRSSPSIAELGFDRIYLHHVGTEQDALPRHVRRARAARRCRRPGDEDHRPQRPLVEDGGRLLPRRRDLHGLERRRLGRLRGPRASARPPRRARRDVHLADAVPAHARPRRRLRHHRLHGVDPRLGVARRRRRVHPHRAGPRHAGDHRLRDEPHLRPASVVQVGAAQPHVAVPRLLRVARRTPEEAGADGLPGRGGQRLGARRAHRPVLPAQLLPAPARPEHREPRACATRSRRRSASGWSSASRASGSTRCRSSSSRPRASTSATRTSSCATSAGSCSAARARRCCSAR